MSKTSLHRLGKISLWILPVLLAGYLLLGLADYTWYRFQIPVGFYNANWTGQWETKRYGGMSGRLLIRLPDPIPENEDFQAEALVYYPIYSVWKTGRFVKMDFQGRFSPDAASTAGDTNNRIPSRKSSYGGKFTFKARAGNQTVEYTAVRDDYGNRIIGAYLSRSPDDYGHFWIKYY